MHLCQAVHNTRTLGRERGTERTRMSQRLPQPACDNRVQRGPERRLERLPEPPVAPGALPA